MVFVLGNSLHLLEYIYMNELIIYRSFLIKEANLMCLFLPLCFLVLLYNLLLFLMIKHFWMQI